MKIDYEMVGVGNDRNLKAYCKLEFYGFHDMKSDYGSPMADEMIPGIKEDLKQQAIKAMETAIKKAKEKIE
jgi:hypothetical protein